VAGKDRSDWVAQSFRLIELSLSAFESALLGLPSVYPAEQKHWFAAVRFDTKSDAERLEREICDAFFLRLKGLFEAQLKQLPGSSKPDWRSVNQLLQSLAIDSHRLSPEDQIALGQFCALRNCIAHNDGKVDAALNGKIQTLSVGTDIWFMRSQLRCWFSLVMRVAKCANAEALSPVLFRHGL